MKRLLFFFTLLCASMIFYGCEKSQVDETIVEEEVVTPEVDEEIEEELYLSDIDEDNIPEDDVWVILDESATAEDFEGLAAAIAALSESGEREVELEFPSLKTLPAFIVGSSTTKADEDGGNTYEVLISVTAKTATEIEAWAFAYCSGLTTLILPAATTIGEGAFCGCEALTTVELATNGDALLSSIGSYVFGGVSENIFLTSGSVNYDFVVDNTLTVGTYSADFGSITLIDEDGNEVDGAVTPSATVTLADITADSIPEEDLWIITDTTAEGSDFAGFSAAIVALSESGREISLEFPNLEAIPDYAISGGTYNSGFASDAVVSIKADVATSVGEYAFRGCTSLISIELPAATTIGGFTFGYCTNLTSVELPVATSIGSFAFYECSALTSVELPVATTIGYFAFEGCSALTTIELPKAVSFGKGVFCSCTSLSSFTIPSTVTEIGGGIFANCSNLTSLTCNSSHFVFDGGVLYDSSKTTIISAVGNPSSIYSDSVTIIEDYAFADCTALTSIDLPAATTIGECAFRYCTALTSVELPVATSIGVWAFYGCTALTSVELPVATSIGYNTFTFCTALTSVELPAATSIGGAAFEHCYALTSVKLPVATTIGMCAFDGCYALTSVELPVATTIGWWAFSYCTALTEVSLATDEGVVLESVSSTAFAYITTTDINLTIGEANSDYVSGNKLTVGDFSEIFKSITLVDGGNEVEDPSVEWQLSDFSATNIPEKDIWIITDASAESDDFDGLGAAMNQLASSGREISLEFPNLKSFPAYAIVNSSSAYFASTDYSALVSIKADVATTVWNNNFYQCTQLKRVELPATTKIGDNAFYGCTALTEASLATNDGVLLSSIGSTAFEHVTTTDVNLTIGAANSDYVSGNKLTVGDFSATFKSITLK